MKVAVYIEMYPNPLENLIYFTADITRFSWSARAENLRSSVFSVAYTSSMTFAFCLSAAYCLLFGSVPQIFEGHLETGIVGW